VEAGVSFGWETWVGEHGKVIGIDTFGASAPGELVMEKYGFRVSNVMNAALDLLQSVRLSNEDRNNGYK